MNVDYGKVGRQTSKKMQLPPRKGPGKMSAKQNKITVSNHTVISKSEEVGNPGYFMNFLGSQMRMIIHDSFALLTGVVVQHY